MSLWVEIELGHRKPRADGRVGDRDGHRHEPGAFLNEAPRLRNVLFDLVELLGYLRGMTGQCQVEREHKEEIEKTNFGIGPYPEW